MAILTFLPFLQKAPFNAQLALSPITDEPCDFSVTCNILQLSSRFEQRPFRRSRSTALQNAFRKYMWYNMAKLSVEIWTLSQEENEYLYFPSSQLILSSASHYDLCSFFPRLKLCPAEGNNWPIWPAAAAAGTTLHTGENKDTLVFPVSPHCPPALITLTSNPHWSKCKTYN